MADFGVRITLAASSPVPTYTGGIFASGVAKLSGGLPNLGWTSGKLIDVSALGEQVDIAKGGNYASVDDFDCTLEATWWPTFEAAAGSLYGALVEVGTLSSGTLTVRWSGTVSDISWQGAELRITSESLITQRHRTLPARILTAQEFAGLPSDSEGSPVPILYGAVERTTPASLASERDYLTAMAVYTGSDPDPIYRSTTIIATSFGAPAATVTDVPLAWIIISADAADTPDREYQDDVWWLQTVGTVYMEIVSGAGAGQSRRISGPSPSGAATINGNTLTWATVPLAAPLDTLPDETSVIRFYLQPTGAVLVMGDEATTGSVSVDLDGKSYPIGFAPGAVEDVVTADVSAEFVAGEDYAAILYQRPSVDFGVSALSDGLTASAGYAASIMVINKDTTSSPSVDVYDYLCRGEIDVNDLPDYVLAESPTVFVMFAASTPEDGKFEIAMYGQRWDGTVDQIQAFELINVESEDRSTYSSAILPDGTPGNFSSWAIPADLDVPLMSYAKIQFSAVYRRDDIPSDGVGTGPITWTFGATSVVVAFDPAGLFAVGDFIRPYAAATPPTVLDDVFTYGSRGGFLAYGGDHTLWREITSITYTGSGTNYSVFFADPITIATGSYESRTATAAQFRTVTMYECGLAFSFGSIPQDSQFLASTSAGRTYGAHWTTLPSGITSGDPVVQARDMAQDILLRDLGLTLSQIDGYDTLPDATVSAILADQEDSARTLARMCDEFNWVGAHDAQGREVATAWLERLYTASADYSVTSADMVEGSISGVDATSLDDVVTLPRVSWSLTQADGFREQGTVTDCTADPDDIDPSNYLRTITGFGDYSTALNAYQILHEAWKRSGVRRSDEFEYRYGGNPTDLLLPARMEWAASRKDILTFRVNEGHASAAAYCGQRIAVTHKRYTGGGTAYGTLVAAYWDPQEGQTQLTVMMDPTVFPAIAVMIDTIDPTETVPEYVDTLDATEATDTYVDTLGDG